MSSICASAIVLGCVLAGAALGMCLRRVLPEHHLNTESKDVVKAATGLIATMAALALGLMVSSAKTHYDIQANELTEISAKVVLLDHVLGHFGPETKPARAALHHSIEDALGRLWSKEDRASPPSEGPSDGNESLLDEVQQLTPKDDRQRALQTQAVALTIDLGRMRWLQYAQESMTTSLPLPFLLVFWLTTIFTSFGLHAPANGTVLVSLFVAALSVASAIFLILELNAPYRGLIHLSSAPLRDALAQLGR